MGFNDNITILLVTLASIAALGGFFAGLILTFCALGRLCSGRSLRATLRSLLTGWACFLTGWWFIVNHQPGKPEGVLSSDALSTLSLCFIVGGSLWFFRTWRTFRQEVHLPPKA